MVDAAVAGRVVRAVEPLHSMVYFADEAESAYPRIGLRPGRMGYFASRSAAMGEVCGAVVAATFYNFSPDLVARYIPRAWSLATPADVVAVRLEVADRALTRLLGTDALAAGECAELTRLLRLVTEDCQPEGRPLYAAHAGLEWPTEPALELWHAVTLLREHRGDGHLAALIDADLSGVQALVLQTLTGTGFRPAFAQASRGWSDEQWTGAVDDLTRRGLVADGGLTERGATIRRDVEDATDRNAAAAFAHVSEPQAERIIRLGGAFCDVLIAGGAFPAQVFAPGSGRIPA